MIPIEEHAFGLSVAGTLDVFGWLNDRHGYEAHTRLDQFTPQQVTATAMVAPIAVADFVGFAGEVEGLVHAGTGQQIEGILVVALERLSSIEATQRGSVQAVAELLSDLQTLAVRSGLRRERRHLPGRISEILSNGKNPVLVTWLGMLMPGQKM